MKHERFQNRERVPTRGGRFSRPFSASSAFSAVNNSLRRAGMLTLVFVFALSFSSCEENDPVTVTETPNLTQRATWQASLTGTGSGTLQIADFGPYFNAQLSVTAAPSTQYQWRIYVGTCQVPGATLVQYGPNQAYPNLLTSASGAAQLTRTIAGPLSLTGSYFIRVSTVATPVTIVACGNLQH